MERILELSGVKTFKKKAFSAGWILENASKLYLLRFLSGKSAAFFAVEIKTSFTRITVEP